MSIAALAWAKSQRVGDPLAKLLLLALADYANHDGEAWPSIDTLERDTEMSRSSVIRRLAMLEEQGFVTVMRRKKDDGSNEVNTYRLSGGVQQTLPSVCEIPPSPPELTEDQLTGGVCQTPKPINNRDPKIEKPTTATPHGGPTRIAPLAPEFEPTARDLQWCASACPLVDVPHETERFIDYWLARGSAKANWNAAWRDWMRRAVKDYDPAKAPTAGGKRNKVIEALEHLETHDARPRPRHTATPRPALEPDG